MAAVGDHTRFITSSKMVAYLGLDPRSQAVRGDTRTQRPHQQARISVRTVGAGRGRVDHGAATRADARVL